MANIPQTAAYKLPFKLDEALSKSLSQAFFGAVNHKRVTLSAPENIDYSCVFKIPLRSAWDNNTYRMLDESELFTNRYDVVNLTWDWNPGTPFMAEQFRLWYAKHLSKYVHLLTIATLYMQARNTRIPRHSLSFMPTQVMAKAAKSLSKNFSIRIPITTVSGKYGTPYIKLDNRFPCTNYNGLAMLVNDDTITCADAAPFNRGEIILSGLFDIDGLMKVAEAI